MIGMVMAPVVTTSDVGLPEIVPYRPDEITAIFAGPPADFPVSADARSKKNSDPRQRSNADPNSTNRKAYVPATRSGTPNSPSVVKIDTSRNWVNSMWPWPNAPEITWPTRL